MDRNYDVLIVISKYLYFNIIKIESMFIKKTYKTQTRLNELEIVY